MARTVGDLRLIDRAVAGWDETDPMAVPSFGGEPDTAPAGIRVAFFEDDGRVPVTAETRAAVRSAASAAAAAGFEVEEYRPPVLARTGPLWDVFFAEVGLLALNDELGGAERDLPILKAHREQAARPPLTALDLTAAWVARDLARADYQAQLGPSRVLVCPVAAIPAFGHGERAWGVDGRRVGYLDAMRYTHAFNVLGAPAVTVPVTRTPEGLPIGVQVAGRPHEDELVLHVAEAIERGCGGYRPPPGFAGG
jgi:Asp-tRNA(Asn)/Glu-tRNA(Gln) amidotransferase A subunit family amidase